MKHCYYKYPPADAHLPNPIPQSDPIFPASQDLIAYLERLDDDEHARPTTEAASTDLLTRLAQWTHERFYPVLELSRLSFVEFANRTLQIGAPSEIHLDAGLAEAARRVVALAFYIWHERYLDRLTYANKRWLEALLTKWIQEAKRVWRKRTLDSSCQEWVEAGFEKAWHVPSPAMYLQEELFRLAPETQLPPTDTVENIIGERSDAEVRAWVDRSLAYAGSSWLIGGEPERTMGAPVDSAANYGTDRRKAIDDYINEVSSLTGKLITRTDIWKAARYKTRTEFERWQRKDRRATKAAHDRFTRILAEKPHLR